MYTIRTNLYLFVTYIELPACYCIEWEILFIFLHTHSSVQRKCSEHTHTHAETLNTLFLATVNNNKNNIIIKFYNKIKNNNKIKRIN